MNRRKFLYMIRAWLLVPSRRGIDFRAKVQELLAYYESRFQPSYEGETWQDFAAWATDWAEEVFPNTQTIEETLARVSRRAENARKRSLGVITRELEKQSASTSARELAPD